MFDWIPAPTITGFELALGACFGMVAFEWTRRLVKNIAFGAVKFSAWVGCWGKSPQFLNRRKP